MPDIQGYDYATTCAARSPITLDELRELEATVASSVRDIEAERAGVWIAAAMAATCGDIVHLLCGCPQCEQRFQPLHLPFREVPASSRRRSRLIRAPSSEPRRRLRRPRTAFVRSEPGRLNAWTAGTASAEGTLQRAPGTRTMPCPRCSQQNPPPCISIRELLPSTTSEHRSTDGRIGSEIRA